MENLNGTADDTLFGACLQHILAHVEGDYSNSRVEAFWRILNHRWLFPNSPDTVARLRALVEAQAKTDARSACTRPPIARCLASAPAGNTSSADSGN